MIRSPESRQPVTHNLLGTPTWEYLAGVTPQKNDELRITHTGMAILGQGGEYSEFWPIPAYGPYIASRGDFTLNASLSSVQHEAALTLYGELPLVYDERRYEQGTLRVAVEDGSLWAGIWDGSGDDPAVSEEWFFEQTETVSLSIIREDDQLAFIVNGQLLGNIPDADIFEEGRFWLGLDSVDEGGSFTVSKLSVEAPRASRLQLVDPEVLKPARINRRGFQELAKQARKGFLIGTAASLEPLVSDAKYAALFKNGWFGSITPENAMKMQFIQPKQGAYAFGQANAIAELARMHNITVHGHTLVFGEANPQWVMDIAAENPEQLETTMTDHITTVMTHFDTEYPGTVTSWDVVNEPLAEDARPGRELRRHIWQQAMGERYIDKAFRSAHKADPEALLFMNEWGLDDPDMTERWDAFLALIDRLLERGVPIHGVGFQGHVYNPGDEIDSKVLAERFKQLEDRGLLVRVSELDVHQEHGEKAQAEQFAAVLKACLEAPNCVGVTTWGITEKYGSTANTDGEVPEIGTGLPWDAKYKDHFAVSTMQRVLQKHSRGTRQDRTARHSREPRHSR